MEDERSGVSRGQRRHQRWGREGVGRRGRGEEWKKEAFRKSQVSVSGYNWSSVSGKISWPQCSWQEWRHCIYTVHTHLHTHTHLKVDRHDLILCQGAKPQVESTAWMWHLKLHFTRCCCCRKRSGICWSSVTVGKPPAVQLQSINRFNTLTACDHWPEVNSYEATNQ